MKLTHREFLRLSPEDKKQYRNMHGESFTEEAPMRFQSMSAADTADLSEGGSAGINSNRANYGCLFLCSFFIPFVGYIAGAILLTKPDGQKAGGACIVLAIAGNVAAFLCWLILTAH